MVASPTYSIADVAGSRKTNSVSIEDRPRCGDAQRDEMLRRLDEVLVCPDCHGELTVTSASNDGACNIECANCGQVGQRLPSQVNLGGFTKTEFQMDSLNRLKEMAKRRLAKFYPLAMSIIAPVHLRNLIPGFLKTFDLSSDLVADLGSGTSCYDKQVLCVDGGNYPNVHLTTDLSKLPFRDDSLSGIVSIAVLEHVPDPIQHVAEFRRVLKSGGRVLCYIPFMQGYHASPYDFQRYTVSGMKKLFEDFDDVKVHVGAGPTSGFIWILQEWLALAFSFGSLRLYRLLVPLTWILSPLKYLDLLLIHHPAANVIASAFYVEAKKAKPD